MIPDQGQPMQTLLWTELENARTWRRKKKDDDQGRCVVNLEILSFFPLPQKETLIARTD